MHVNRVESLSINATRRVFIATNYSYGPIIFRLKQDKVIHIKQLQSKLVDRLRSVVAAAADECDAHDQKVANSNFHHYNLNSNIERIAIERHRCAYC